jgi:hypothetical protein
MTIDRFLASGPELSVQSLLSRALWVVDCTAVRREVGGRLPGDDVVVHHDGPSREVRFRATRQGRPGSVSLVVDENDVRFPGADTFDLIAQALRDELGGLSPLGDS